MNDISDFWGFEASVAGKTVEEVEAAFSFRRYHLGQQGLKEDELQAALAVLEEKRDSILQKSSPA